MRMLYRIRLADRRCRNQLGTLDSDPARRHRHRRPRRRTTDLSADRHAAHNLAAFGNDVVDLAATSQKLAHASINSYRVYQTCRRPEATATTQRNEE